MYFKSSKEKKTNSAINSAALQDHLLKKFNFNFEDTKPNSFGHNLPPARRKTHEKLPSINRAVQSEIKKLELAQKKSILPYEDETLKKLKEAKEDQVKMTKYTKSLTLAQKLGLVEAPPLPLTAKDWLSIEEKSRARNDSDNCCSICLQDFRVQPQTILSCSHVFHAQCLSSYQKHNKAKCCPICRRRDYEKKQIDQALKVYTLKCILRIQRVFRGSCSRIRLYGHLVESKYQANSVRFRRRVIGYKMWRLSHRIEERVKVQAKYFNKLLKEVEEKHEKSKEDILAEMVEIQRKKIVETGEVEKYLKILGLGQDGPKKEEEKVDWESVKVKGINRQEQQCAICLMSLWARPVCLLSCTHMFHATCVEGFQRYALPGNQNKCPVCRCYYQKRLIKQEASHLK